MLRSRSLNIGVTWTRLATPTDGRLTHCAYVQAIDESKTKYQIAMGTELNFRDCCAFNIGVYRLHPMLGLQHDTAIDPASLEGHGLGLHVVGCRCHDGSATKKEEVD